LPTWGDFLVRFASTSFSYEQAGLWAKLVILSAGSSFELKRTRISRAPLFVSHVHNRMSSAHTASTQPQQDAIVPGEDILSKLERLKSLRDDGVLTVEEFDEQKQRILNA
jgi:hypothetical protein